MGWLFGRKKREKSTRHISATFDLHDRHTAEEAEFDRSEYGKVLRKHFSLSVKLKETPAAEQARVAKSQVAFAAAAAEAYMAKERMLARHLRESGNGNYFPQMPRHSGYERLAINLEKEKRFDAGVELCRRAQHEGWAGDWDTRIERMQRKANKG